MTLPNRSPSLRQNTTLLVAAVVALLIARTVGAQGTGAPPATQDSARADTAAKSTLPVRQSWTSDRRNFAVGDIVTLLIDDYTISTAVKDNIATDRRNRNLGVTVRLPNQGSRGAGIDSRNDADQQQRGQQRRENRFQNEMSVRVVSVGENGTMQVRGTKLFDVDKSKQEILFEGWIRAQDVSSTNMIESYRVADATLTYKSPGSLGKPKTSIISRILGIFWP